MEPEAWTCTVGRLDVYCREEGKRPRPTYGPLGGSGLVVACRCRCLHGRLCANCEQVEWKGVSHMTGQRHNSLFTLCVCSPNNCHCTASHPTALHCATPWYNMLLDYRLNSMWSHVLVLSSLTWVGHGPKHDGLFTGAVVWWDFGGMLGCSPPGCCHIWIGIDASSPASSPARGIVQDMWSHSTGICMHIQSLVLGAHIIMDGYFWEDAGQSQ